MIRRRAFLTLLGGAVAWPLGARAEQPERMRRIGVLMNPLPDDPEAQARATMFLQELHRLGWAAGAGLLGAMQSVAPTFGIELSPIRAGDAHDIESAITTFAREARGGLIVTPSGGAVVHRELIINLAQHHLPAVYPYRFFVTEGGLASYGPDTIDQYRRAAAYVDRLLKGEKPGNLPVQTPTKFELVINLITAKALGLEIPPTLLARADEVIE